MPYASCVTLFLLKKLFLLLSYSAISQYFLYGYFYLYFPQFIQEMLILSARGLGEFISNQLETRYKELWLRVQCCLYYSQKAMQANKHELEREKREVGIKKPPLLSDSSFNPLSGAGTRKAGTEWTCRKLTRLVNQQHPVSKTQHSWCRDSGEQTREGTGFILAFVARKEDPFQGLRVGSYLTLGN